MASFDSFWNQYLESYAKSQKQIPVLLSFLRQTSPLEINEDKIVLSCPNNQLKLFLERRAPEIETSLLVHGKKKLSVELVVVEQKKKITETPLLSYQPPLVDVLQRSGLHSKYSLDNFAVSSTNQVAYAAAQAISNNPGHAYNPLFLHGGVGVGKTHLAQAVGRLLLEQGPERRVFFCPADQFVNELIESIREKTTPRFRRKYRSLHLLIVDDIQFIAGKQAVQEEFFHTFNTIMSAGGQLILTSDRPPQEIKQLEDRLRSRFSGGLTVDIQPPDFELRTAILLIKAREKDIEIDIESAKIIADQITDTRALEGTLLTLYSRTLGKKEAVDLDTVNEFFSKKQEAVVKRLAPQDILKIICSFYNIKLSHLKGSSRTTNLVLPRQIAMYILRTMLKMRQEEIAYFLNKKDHTTVIHAVEKINRLMLRDPVIRGEVEQIEKSLRL